MTIFDQWTEAFIFASIFSAIILIPCIIILLMGRKMISQLGNYPSKAPEILFGVCFKYLAVMVLSLFSMVAFYSFFSANL